MLQIVYHLLVDLNFPDWSTTVRRLRISSIASVFLVWESILNCSGEPVFLRPYDLPLVHLFSAALVRQWSSYLIVVLLFSSSFEVMVASLAREKTEDSDLAVLRELRNTASHLLSRLRAWIFKARMSVLDGVVIDFLLMKEVSISLLLLIIAGTSLGAGIFLRSLVFSRRRHMKLLVASLCSFMMSLSSSGC